MEKRERTNEAVQAAKKHAARFAALKRKAAPILAEIEKLSEDLKAFFRAHVEVNALGDVGFSVTNRTTLDTKAVRAELGARISEFERITPVETLSLLRKAR